MNYDDCCDYCARMSPSLAWHPIGQGINYLCPACLDRENARETEEDRVEAAWKDAGYSSSLQVWQAEGR